MEGIIFFLLIAAAVIFILPIAAFIRAGQARADALDARAQADRTTARLSVLERELAALKERPVAKPEAQPQPSDAAMRKPAPAAASDAAYMPSWATAPSPSTPLESAPVPLPPIVSEVPALAAQTTTSRPGAALATPEVLSSATVAPPPVPLIAPDRRVSQAPSQAPAGHVFQGAEEPMAPAKPAFNWEQFIGIKLFAWIAGVAIFLAAGYFLQWSFEHNLIKPPVRVAIGLLTGLGLIVGGLRLPRERYAIMVQSLTATGVLVLYASIFAASSPKVWNLLGNTAGFGCMIVVTVTAFLLATRLEAPTVAIMGLLGGFLTPVLLSTGGDHPLGLFGYIGLLDLGLLAVALRKRWNYLTPLAAGATILMQYGWVVKFFNPDKIDIGMAVFVGFSVLFGMISFMAGRDQPLDQPLRTAALALPASAIFFGFYLVLGPYPGICAEPWKLFGYVFAIDAVVLVIATVRRELRISHAAVGGAVFLLLALWTQQSLTNALLNWALGLYLLFGLVHAVYPVAIERWRPSGAPQWMAHLAAPMSLLLIFIPLFKLATLSLAIWPVILLVDLLAILLAAATFALLGVFAVLLLTMAVAACWILRGPAVLTDLPETLIIVGGFAVVFFIASLFLARKLMSAPAAAPGMGATTGSASPWDLLLKPSPELARKLVPTLSGLLPFALLILMVLRLPLANPSPVFGLAALMTVLMLGLVRYQAVDGAGLGAFVGVTLLELSWHFNRFDKEAAVTPLGWYLGFYGAFTVFPFLFQRELRDRVLPWIVAALAGPIQFFLVHRLVKAAYPNDYMGLIPAAFVVPSLLALVRLIQTVPADAPRRNTQFALFGGVALFFITLIFPIQFDKQWITVAWALEGAALFWLYHRVPHEGLRLAGLGLLVTAFVRLALNPAVFEYHARTGTIILNWYLYAYGAVVVCLFAGAQLLAPPRNMVLKKNIPPILQSLGTVLAFFLINIEIADAYSTGQSITFEFSGSLARDMTYSLAWGVFSLVILVVGIRRQLPPPRYAGLALLVVTLLKLFFHDIWQLGGFYRIGSLIGLALVLIPVSLLYQRFLAPGSEGKKKSEPHPTQNLQGGL